MQLPLRLARSLEPLLENLRSLFQSDIPQQTQAPCHHAVECLLHGLGVFFVGAARALGGGAVVHVQPGAALELFEVFSLLSHLETGGRKGGGLELELELEWGEGSV